MTIEQTRLCITAPLFFFALLLNITCASEVSTNSSIVSDNHAPFVIKEYDESGRVTRIVDATGSITEYVYSTSGKVLAERIKIDDRNWAEYRSEYDGNDRIVRKTGPMGEDTRYIRNEKGLPTYVLFKVDEARWAALYFKYDSADNIIFQSNYYFINDAEHPEVGQPSEGMRYGYNHINNKVFEIDPLGCTTSYEYDKNGIIAARVDPMGNKTIYEHAPNGKLVKETDPNGGSTEWIYDASGNPVEVRGSSAGSDCSNCGQAAGVVELPGQYEWTNGLITTYTDPTGRTTRYEYDVEGRKIRETDAGGDVSYFEYDVRGLLIAETNIFGGITRHEYDAAGRRIKSTDPQGNVNNIIYDMRGWARFISSPDKGEEEFLRDNSGRILALRKRMSSDKWFTTTYKYDLRGNKIETCHPDGTVERFEYDPAGRLLSATLDSDGLGIRFSHRYDVRGKRTETTDAMGNTTFMKYDPNGNLIAVISPEGRRAEFVYDTLNRLVTTILDPGGIAQTQRIAYDRAGNIVELSNGLTSVCFFYDKAGRLIEIERSGRAPLLISHDKAGRVAKVERFNGNPETVSQRVFDAAKRMITETDALGNTAEYHLYPDGSVEKFIDETGAEFTFKRDPVGRILKLLLPEGTSLTYEYDLAGRLAKNSGGLRGDITYGYDARGRRIAQTDANGRSKRSFHDRAGRLVRYEDEMGQTTFFKYDANGRRVTVIDANGGATYYVYDRDGFTTSVIHPFVAGQAKSVEFFTYDRAGRRESKTTADGETLWYRYDAAGNISACYHGERIPDGMDIPVEKLLISYERDDAGAIIRETDPLTTMEYEYDWRGFLAEAKDSTLNKSVQYDYNAAGRRTVMRIMDYDRGAEELSMHVAYEYDKSGLLAQVRQDENSYAIYRYNRDGKRISLALSNGVETRYEYDGNGRLIDVITTNNDAVQSRFHYTLDPTGNRMGIEYADGSRSTYNFDAANRLTEESRTDREGTSLYHEVFTYDALGNRLTRVSTLAGKTHYVYNARNELISETDGNRVRQYEYDRKGNVTRIVNPEYTESFSYDRLNRLIRYEGKEGVEETFYRGIGWFRWRTTRSVENSIPKEEYYLYDDNNVVGDYSRKKGERRIFDKSYITPFLDENVILTMRGAGERRSFYYSHDGLGSVRKIYDEAGTVSAEYDYSAFGLELPSIDNPVVSQRYRYTGREKSHFTPFLFYRLRPYDAQCGRMTNRNPWGFIQARFSLYNYAFNSPVRFVEPFSWVDGTDVPPVAGPGISSVDPVREHELQMIREFIREKEQDPEVIEALNRISQRRKNGDPDWKEKGKQDLLNLDEKHPAPDVLQPYTAISHNFRNILQVCPATMPEKKDGESCYKDHMQNIWQYEKPNSFFHVGLQCFRGEGEFSGSQCCYNKETKELDDSSDELGTFDYAPPAFTAEGTTDMSWDGIKQNRQHLSKDVTRHNMSPYYSKNRTQVY